MNPEERQAYLQSLREEGFNDALNGNPSQSKSLPGPEERHAYLEGFEEHYFQKNPDLEAELRAQVERDKLASRNSRRGEGAVLRRKVNHHDERSLDSDTISRPKD